MVKLKLGRYKHYKGKIYNVLGIAKHSESLEELVIYECLYDNPTGKIWARPLKMFKGKVNIGGDKIPRFKYIEEK